MAKLKLLSSLNTNCLYDEILTRKLGITWKNFSAWTPTSQAVVTWWHMLEHWGKYAAGIGEIQAYKLTMHIKREIDCMKSGERKSLIL